MSGAVAAIREATESEGSNAEMAVDRAVREVAGAIAAELEGVRPLPAALVRRIRTGVAVYHVRGSLMPKGPDRPATVVVVVERRDPEPPSEPELRLLFGLTKKEATVARLLAFGRSNLEIAHELCISHHTARHHTENVLGKLKTRARENVRDILHRAAADID